MEKTITDKKVVSNDEKQKTKKPLEPNEFSGNDKSAKSLGDGRWKYQGKTYKEESIGKS
jgi:hypothetical protein